MEENRENLKAQLREELKNELKEELRKELREELLSEKKTEEEAPETENPLGAALFAGQLEELYQKYEKVTRPE